MLNKYRSSCPLSSSLDLVGDKWSLIIIRDIFIGRNTYSEFLKSPEEVSSNVLVDRLKKLVSFGIIDYVKDKKDRKIKYYFLTDIGIDFYPIITELSLLSKKHFNKEIHPLSIDTFKNIDEIGLVNHNIKTVDSYLLKKEMIITKQSI